MDSTKPRRREHHHHDWHSADYVGRWIDQDLARQDSRRPLLDGMISLVPFAPAAAIRVLDVAGGYGVVAGHVLARFPQAEVTIQDYSGPMLAEARKRFAAQGDRVRYVVSDLNQRGWTKGLRPPYDLVVSGIALHNLEMAAIEACYRDIAALLKPGGWFLDCDHFGRAGGVAAHLASLQAAGFADVRCVWEEGPTGIVQARRGAL